MRNGLDLSRLDLTVSLDSKLNGRQFVGLYGLKRIREALPKRLRQDSTLRR